MLKSNFFGLALYLATGFASITNANDIVNVEGTATLLLSDYCWGPDHFLSVDFSRVEFLQFVNKDMIFYQIIGEEAIYCAYPTDNDSIERRAKERGVKFSKRLGVLY